VKLGKLNKKIKYWFWRWIFGADQQETSRRENVRNEVIREKWI
jgi:hypothetical protein